MRRDREEIKEGLEGVLLCFVVCTIYALFMENKNVQNNLKLAQILCKKSQNSLQFRESSCKNFKRGYSVNRKGDETMIYLKRKIDTFLEEWKQNSERKPLIVKGPRQVGKTESIRKFAEKHWQSPVMICIITRERIQVWKRISLYVLLPI